MANLEEIGGGGGRCTEDTSFLSKRRALVNKIAQAFNLKLCLFAVLWKDLIIRYGGRANEQLDLSSLAKITDGYTPGHMVQAIQQILTERRIQQVSVISRKNVANKNTILSCVMTKKFTILHKYFHSLV